MKGWNNAGRALIQFCPQKKRFSPSVGSKITPKASFSLQWEGRPRHFCDTSAVKTLVFHFCDTSRAGALKIHRKSRFATPLERELDFLMKNGDFLRWRLWASWAVLGVSWRLLGVSWPLLGLSWPLPWAVLGVSWRLLGLSWRLLGLSWPLLPGLSRLFLALALGWPASASLSQP